MAQSHTAAAPGSRDATTAGSTPAGFGDDWRLPPGPIALEPAGFRLIPAGRPQRLIPYGAVTHLATTPRGLWLGTSRGASLLRRAHFRDPDGPEQLSQELVRRIAERPGGMAQLARFAEIEQLSRSSSRRWAAFSLVLLCAAVYVLQLFDPFVEEVGAFVPELVREGQLWRVATANFLHGVMPFHLHLVVNSLCILGLAFIVERPLGSLTTLLVMGASGISAMAASAAVGDGHVVGASGIAAGLAGAALCLELRHPDRIPAGWRLPRRIFITALVADGMLGFVVPSIAGAAHLGGFAAGYLVTRTLAADALYRRPPARLAHAALALLTLALLLSFSATRSLISRDAEALNAYALDLLELDEVWPKQFNDLAWRMATEADATREQLETAIVLAELAVENDRDNPDLLDTLAELRFSLGDREGAIATIEEAIRLSRGERYFHEQRRRFTGERGRDDRPAPPVLPWPYRVTPEVEEPELEIDPDEGIAI